MRVSGVRTRVLLCLLLVLGPVIAVFNISTAHAAQLSARSLTLRQHTGVTTGGSAAGAKADHKFSFTATTTAGINSIGLQYCDQASGTCTTAGNANGINITTGSGASLDATRTNLGSTPTYTSTASNAGYVAFTAPLGGVGVIFQLDNVTNPSAANATFFVRITTYTSANATTGSTDAGTVAASTTNTITVTGIMPEYLAFCTGAQITLVGGGGTIPDCTTATSGAINFNQEFSPSDTSTATSQMAASTNAVSGYVIVATGTTLTSGSFNIPTVGGTAEAVNTDRGTSKFGINLVTNTTTASTPAVGGPIAPASTGLVLQANPTTNFATADSFALDLTGATAIAKSDANTPGSPGTTNIQRYIVSYFTDVSGVQPPGTYVATINYVCTPTF